MSENIPMTLAGKAKLDAELEHLTKVEREEIKQAIAEARAHGDLKENAEYHAAKEKQSLNEGRIMELQNKLGRAQVVNPAEIDSENIVFGATVKLFDVEKEESQTLQIVGEDEADRKAGKISFTSPLGRALIGKQEGDTAIVKAPKGDIEYEIEEVNYK